LVAGGCGFDCRGPAIIGVEMITERVKRIIKATLAAICYRYDSFLDHYNGPDYKFLIQDYDEFLRSKIKYTEEVGSFDEARDELWKKLNERGLTIWD